MKTFSKDTLYSLSAFSLIIILVAPIFLIPKNIEIGKLILITFSIFSPSIIAGTFIWHKVFFKANPIYQIIETKGTIIGNSYYKIKIVWQYTNWQIFEYYSIKGHPIEYKNLEEAQESVKYLTQEYKTTIVSTTTIES